MVSEDAVLNDLDLRQAQQCVQRVRLYLLTFLLAPLCCRLHCICKVPTSFPTTEEPPHPLELVAVWVPISMLSCVLLGMEKIKCVPLRHAGSLVSSDEDIKIEGQDNSPAKADGCRTQPLTEEATLALLPDRWFSLAIAPVLQI